ncbi:MAG: energy transducer TonB [Prevotella sp.]|nr:energy transducer TonB [Prevotella sp.]
MKHLLSLLLTLLSLTLCAQTVDNTAQKYAMRYVKDHLFLQHGEDFNVIDTDIEWPELLSYSQVQTQPLQQFLAQQLFGYDTANFDSAYQAYQSAHGQVVSGTLKSLPDDNRFAYITLKAQVKSYAPNHWICYQTTVKIEPQSLSPLKAKDEKHYYVYDIGRKKIFSTEDIVKQDQIQNGNVPSGFFENIFAPLSDDDFNQITSAALDGVWLVQKSPQVGLHITCRTADKQLDYETLMPYDDVRSIVTKNGRTLFEKPVPPVQPEFVTLPNIWKGDTIYYKVENAPEFRGGQEGLKAYLAHVSAPKAPLPGRVITAFVVDKTGAVQDVRVISPLSPELDRHAVALVKGMPKFAPGTLKGSPVCVRMYLPISYREEKTNSEFSE